MINSVKALLLVTAFSLPGLTATTYSIVENDEMPGDWSLDGGTFTTNGFVGTVNGTDFKEVITDWSIEMTSVFDSYVFTPANSGLEVTARGQETVVEIESDRILLPFRDGDTITLTSDGGQAIVWEAPKIGGNMEGIFITGYFVRLRDRGRWSQDFGGECYRGFPTPCDFPEGLVIAVPEPAALGLLLAGSFVATSLRKRRGVARLAESSKLRAGRKQSASVGDGAG